jgi:hypothetical protein
LAFLAAYLRSQFARYFLFHTSSNWGISRQEVHVNEVLRLPFPLPEQQANPHRAWQIVREVAKILGYASRVADSDLVDRNRIVQDAAAKIEPLIEEYFDVVPSDRVLVEDTVKTIIPSTQPTRAKLGVPSITPATQSDRQVYLDRLCGVLNDWAKQGSFRVRGQVQGADLLGIGVAVIEKVERSHVSEPMAPVGRDLLQLLGNVRKAIPRRHPTLDVVRGVMVFDRTRLYVVKPCGRRFWTQTAAMNDADEIAATILMRPLMKSP